MINWKVRFKHKPFLVAFFTTIVAFIYQMLGIFEIVPAISQDQVVQLIGLVINILVGVGVVADPTTAGMGDSNQALEYTEPRRG